MMWIKLLGTGVRYAVDVKSCVTRLVECECII